MFHAEGYGEPSVVPWRRQYVPDVDRSREEQVGQTILSCADDPRDVNVIENDAVGPRIAVLGDSGTDLLRPVALKDSLFHWMFASHCGEKFATLVDSPRVHDAVALNPDVLVFNLGSNDTSEGFQLRPELIDGALRDLQRLMDATESVRCRVIVDLPAVPGPDDSPEGGRVRVDLTSRINEGLYRAASRPGVQLARWSDQVRANPRLVSDYTHPTPAGLNALMNTILETSETCLHGSAPGPAGVHVTASESGDTVEWEPGGDVAYLVEVSDGRFVKTAETSLTFQSNGTGGDPLRYRVTAVSSQGNWSVASDWIEAGSPPNPIMSPRGAVAVVLLVVCCPAFGLAVRRRWKRS